MGPQHGDTPPSDAETISSSEEKSGWDNINPESYERYLRNDPVPMGCHKVVDPNGGYYRASRKCCGKMTTVRCPFCTLPLCDQHMGQCSGKDCAWKEQRAKQADGTIPLPAFNPDLTMGENVPVRGAKFLPARMAPEPAPLDSEEHYPRMAMVQVGDVSVPIRDGRAVRPKTNENAKIKIRTVPARPRSVSAAPRQPDPKDALEDQVETEGTSNDPIDLETPVKKVERRECTVEEMFPPPARPIATAIGHC